MGTVLDPAFYARDTRAVARDLVGMRLVARGRGRFACAGTIVETEAYLPVGDPACHAARGRTARNATMFGPPGCAYVYFVYGMHHCLNAVTEPVGTPGAVLIRALEPTDGLALMRRRRGWAHAERELANGPAKLCRALAIDCQLDGTSLAGPRLVIEDQLVRPEIATTTRVGITVGCEHAWRYVWAGHPCVSRGRPS